MVYSKKILNIAKEKSTGDWRSWLARLTGSQKVTGSNPVFSTGKNNPLKVNFLRL